MSKVKDQVYHGLGVERVDSPGGDHLLLQRENRHAGSAISSGGALQPHMAGPRPHRGIMTAWWIQIGCMTVSHERGKAHLQIRIWTMHHHHSRNSHDR